MSNELLELGRQVDESYVSPLQRRVGDTTRHLTNVEMAALLTFKRTERDKAADDKACCRLEGPLDDGTCPVGGYCKAFLRARDLLRRLANEQ